MNPRFGQKDLTLNWPHWLLSFSQLTDGSDFMAPLVKL
jgi:hypothetical protein